MPCSVAGCQGTFAWSIEAQLLARDDASATGLCDVHLAERMQLGDRIVPCRITECKRTWVFTGIEQVRALGHHEGDNAPVLAPEPPARLCDPCAAKLQRLRERDASCKVHGCSRSTKIDREIQLRAWAALKTEDIEVDPPVPRRMCSICREFCRSHPDRLLPCIRAGCTNTWTYKTGAQLQAFVAGRLEEPRRECEACGRAAAEDGPARNHRSAGGHEIMPCVVLGCSGTWTFAPGMRIRPADEGTLPPDRMCASCRAERT